MAEAMYIAYRERSKWETCRRCGGTGSRELAEDCHRSGGIIPCECGNGFISSDSVPRSEYERRRVAGELFDHRGQPIAAQVRSQKWEPPTARESTPS